MLVSVVASVCCTAIVGCYGPRRIYPPKVNPEKAAAEAMEMYDTNKDGKLDAEELKKVPSLKPLAKDGVVTSEALIAILKKWASGTIARMRYDVQILHNGQPLEGADVKLVPEKFLGSAWLVATGKTLRGGTAPVNSSPDLSTQGIPLGFYRVEVTKEGESIPAKFNTETTIGMGLIEPPGMGGKSTFDLKY